MRGGEHLPGPVSNENGVTIVLVALCMLVLLGFAALAIDLGYLYVVRNELQNASDAGALAGANVLYNCDPGTGKCTVNTNPTTGAIAVATDTAEANKSEKIQVEILSVDRGHWSFGSKVFTVDNYTTDLPDLTKWTTAQLDAPGGLPDGTKFVNAVRVKTKRTNASSFFAKIWDKQSFYLETEAVAYLGFAGKLFPLDVNEPIAICQQSIINGSLTCTVGRMLNSGSNDTTHNTAGWTNFSQPCQTASASSLKPLTCSGNPLTINLGEGIGATGGVQQTTLDDIIKCWKKSTGAVPTVNNGYPTEPWEIILPVIECDGRNVSNCEKVVGAVKVKVLWITEAGTGQLKAPLQMGKWTAPSSCTNDACRWADFQKKFGIVDVDNNAATLAKKSLYFLPACEPTIPRGTTGGENFGILAKIPVLVK